jgi:hypothetical protein
LNNNAYPFDAESVEVQINARPGADTPFIVTHQLRKPTLTELLDREKAINLEIVEESAREERIVTDDEMATCALWDKIILQVKGYKGIPQFRALTDGEKASMRAGHKKTAILAMYAGSAQVVGDEDEVSLGANTWTIRQLVGPDQEKPLFTVEHVLREPTESERAKFKRTASKVSFIRGAKRARTKIGADLRAYVEIYDALITDIDNGTVKDQPFHTSDRATFLAAIDPTWKRLIVQTLMAALEASLLD